jgi:hypothetical protein
MCAAQASATSGFYSGFKNDFAPKVRILGVKEVLKARRRCRGLKSSEGTVQASK